MECDKPQKSKHGYFVKWLRDDKPMSIILHDVKIDSMESKQITMNRIDSHATLAIEAMDDACLRMVKRNIGEWFKNHRIDKRELANKMVPSISDSIYLSASVSSMKTPKLLKWNGRSFNDYDDYCVAINDDMHKLHGSIELQAFGIYFHPNEFGVRWIVHSMDLVSVDVSEDIYDREEVELHWAREIPIVAEEIDAHLCQMQKRVHFLQAFKSDIQDTFQIAKKQTSGRKWNEKFEALASKIIEFRSGRLQLE